MKNKNINGSINNKNGNNVLQGQFRKELRKKLRLLNLIMNVTSLDCTHIP